MNLRFTPGEYQTLCSACARINPDTNSLHVFRRRLVATLVEVSPKLARRVERLRGEAELLYRHFHPRPQAAVQHDLTEEELSAFADWCMAVKLPVRFVRPFRWDLVQALEGPAPELAAKVARMSGYAFERLYNQAVGRECWGA